MQGLTPDRPARSDRAFVTLVTNADYALGAKALVRSIVLSGTQADICVLHTDVAEAHLAPLSALGARLVRCELLPTSPEFNATHARAALHGRAAFNHALFICAGRLRRCVPRPRRQVRDGDAEDHADEVRYQREAVPA